MDNEVKEIDKEVSNLVENFCKIILTKADFIDIEESNKYIKELKNEQRTVLISYSEYELYDKYIFPLVQKCIFSYLDSYQSESTLCLPFSFDSSNYFRGYQKKFVDTYESCHKQNIPLIFIYIFDYIKEVSAQYAFFERFIIFNNKKNQDSYDYLLEKYKNQLTSSGRQIAEEAAEEAAEKAKSEAHLAKQYAEDASKEAKEAAKRQVKIEVDKKMAEVNSKTSETSVTILGIFAAIVLTAIAGLLYSTSVINNLAEADTCKLICICAFVGVVCVDLISILFYFIEKIKNPETSFGLKKFLIVTNAILLCVAIGFGVYSVTHPQTNKTDGNKSVFETSTSLDEPDEINEINEILALNNRIIYYCGFICI